MKKLILVVVLVFTAGMIFAQHETLLKNAKVRGAFGGPIWEMGIDKNVQSSYGGGGGIIINNVFVGGYGLATVYLEKLIFDGDIEVIDIAHGGFWIGAAYRPYKMLHLYGTTRIGWGALDIKETTGSIRELDRIFVFTPEVGVELNVTSWIHLTGTIGYRMVNGTNPENKYEDKDFGGTMVGISLKFGWFGWRKW